MHEIHFEEMKDEYIDDALDIYNHYIINTNVTFHTHSLSKEQMYELVFFNSHKYMAYVILSDGTICGYVILGPYKKREAYAGTAEVTIYLKPEYSGKGIGSKALKFIEDFAKSHDIHVLIAVICGENAKSINLFAKNGYCQCAHFREVGRKFNKWLDVVAYQKILL